jgi:hypothetical protein
MFSPFPRFIIPCCIDVKEQLQSELKEFKCSLKDLIFGKKIRNFKVLDPLTMMYGDENGDGSKKGYWRLDPVHPSPAGYHNLMPEILGCNKDVSFNSGYSGEQSRGSRGGGSRPGSMKTTQWPTVYILKEAEATTEAVEATEAADH